jgi:hypothetical protein
MHSPCCIFITRSLDFFISSKAVLAIWPSYFIFKRCIICPSSCPYRVRVPSSAWLSFKGVSRISLVSCFLDAYIYSCQDHELKTCDYIHNRCILAQMFYHVHQLSVAAVFLAMIVQHPFSLVHFS